MAAAAALRALAAAGAEFGPEALAWLLSITGAHGRARLCDASDRNIRWRASALLDGFLRAVGLTELPAELRTSCESILLARCSDRWAEVRQSACEALLASKHHTRQTLEALRTRGLTDCSAPVRAACVSAVCSSVDIDSHVILNASLDVAPRVRRALLFACPLQGRSELVLEKTWRLAVLRALGDRSRSVRLAAARCLAADLLSRAVVLNDLDVAAGSVPRMVAGLVTLVRGSEELEDLPIAKLLRCLDPVKSLEALEEATPARVLWARLALSLAAALREAPSAARVVPEVQECLGLLQDAQSLEDQHFKLCQWLHCALVCDMPADTAGRQRLAQAAAAAIQVLPVEMVANEMVQFGIYPRERLGHERVSSPSSNSLELAILLLRRVAADGASGQSAGQAATAQLWFSNLAAAIYENLKKDLDAATAQLLDRQEEMQQMQQELEERRWAEEANRLKLVKAARPDAMEKALQEASREVEELRLLRQSKCLRMVLLCDAWLCYGRGKKQRELLPVLQSVLQEEQSAAAQVGAIHAIALYASQSQEQALAHWDFFLGLLEVQLPLQQATSMRLVELSVLFISDAMLLHGAPKEKATLALARAATALEGRGRASLRAVLWDRLCCLAVYGALEGPAGAWLLGKALEVCCRQPGNESNEPPKKKRKQKDVSDAYTSLGQIPATHTDDSDPEDGDYDGSDSLEAVLRTRLLRFFATLPLMSRAHAAMLLQALGAFFGARLYDSKSAVLAAKLAARRLQGAKELLLVQGCEVNELQLQVLQIISAALLSAAYTDAKPLQDALGAALIACGAFDWEDFSHREAMRALLRDWNPNTSAKSVVVLLHQLHSPGRVSAECGHSFAQEALDAASDFRHDLAVLGIAQNVGIAVASARGAVLKRRIGYWQPPATPALTPARTPAVTPAPEAPEATDAEVEAEDTVERWEILDAGSVRRGLVPRGSGITLGRHASCEVCIPARAVSSRHCVLSCLAGSGKDSLLLRDLSVNGTYVNGIHVKSGEELGLSHGDVVSLASLDGPSFEVRLCRVKEARPPATPMRAKPEAVPEVLPSPAVGQKRPSLQGPKRRLRRKTKDPNFQAPKVDQAPGADEEDHKVSRKVPGQPVDEVQAEEPLEQVALAVVHAKEQAGGSRLVDLSSGKVHFLPAHGILSVGRREDCEVVIPRSVVSGRHVVLVCTELGVELEDVSSNGTFVNETQVPKGFSLPQRVGLRDGDHIFLAHRQGPAMLFLEGEAEDDEE
ncbi:unnamed protein product [Effrenium voratum]|nr:unnamed protein product [Effrenium voratum]